MKCLKSSKTGKIIRVSDKEAYAATSEWKFIPKSEWKSERRPEPKVVEEVLVEVQEQTIAEKQLNKKKKNK